MNDSTRTTQRPTRQLPFVELIYLLSVLACACFIISLLGGPRSHTSVQPTPMVRVEVAKHQPTTPVNIVILAIDGVRWQDIFRGTPGSGQHASSVPPVPAEAILPNLHRLARTRGTLIGSDTGPMMASSPSTVSLPSYSEIFAGYPPSCSNNDCPSTAETTLLDTWLEHEPSAQLAVISSWSRIARVVAKDRTRIAVSAGQSTPNHEAQFCAQPELCRRYRAGMHAGNWPGTEDYRPDHATSALALEYLHVHEPQFLFLGLGDTDEYAHRGDYASYLKALTAADDTLGAISSWLDDKQRQGHRTLLICTTDHGRSRGFNHHGGAPEAARVWALFAGSVVAARGQLVGSMRRLSDIAPTVRAVLALPGEERSNAGHSLLAALNEREQPVAIARTALNSAR